MHSCNSRRTASIGLVSRSPVRPPRAGHHCHVRVRTGHGPRRAAPTVPCGCPRRPIHRRRVRARAPRTRLAGTAGSCPKTLRPAAVDDARATRLRPAGIASPLLFPCDYSSAASCTQTEKTTRARTSACAHPPPGFQRVFTAGVCFGVGVLQRPSPNPVCVLSRNRRERCC